MDFRSRIICKTYRFKLAEVAIANGLPQPNPLMHLQIGSIRFTIRSLFK